MYWLPKVQGQKRSWLPRPIRHVVMGTAIKAFGLDKNADAAEGDWGLGVKKKEGGRERDEGGGGEKQACQQKGLSN